MFKILARSPAFQRMFENDWKETTESKSKISLSEKGLNAFLEYVYSSKIDSAKENPSIAVELLEISHEKEISTLEQEMKNLILGKPDDWLSFDQALQLLVRSIRVKSYECLKKKATATMKL